MPPGNDTTKRRRTVAAVSYLVALGLLCAAEVGTLHLSLGARHPLLDDKVGDRARSSRSQDRKASVDVASPSPTTTLPREDDRAPTRRAKIGKRGKARKARPATDGAETGAGVVLRPSPPSPEAHAARPNSSSPACHPHFDAMPSDAAGSNATKIRRLYFYHASKAGGTSLGHYLVKVAMHHGLEFASDEKWAAAKPGAFGVPTLYVTHLREPVERSISHFKYSGRWKCLVRAHMRKQFVPTEDNARKLETWNSTGGHVPFACDRGGVGRGPAPAGVFRLEQCAVNCYTQWFSGLCPRRSVSVTEQYQGARRKLLQYNMIVDLARLRDPAYVAAVERFFGVPGLAERRGAVCENWSRHNNKAVPLVVRDDTRERLTELNRADVGLYRGLTECLDARSRVRDYGFPAFAPARFERVSVKVPYQEWEQGRPRGEIRDALERARLDSNTRQQKR